MAERMTFTEFRNGRGKVKQYVQCGSSMHVRETITDYADHASGGWAMVGLSAAPSATAMEETGWTLAGEPVTFGISINDYDTLHRVIGSIPRDAWSYVHPYREKYDAAAKSALNLDKSLPVSPLVKGTKTFGGVRKYEIPLDFLHEGTLFTVTRKHEVIDAVAHMDGHSVSRSYGRVNGGDHFIGNDNPENYINVRFPGRDYTRVGYPNDGLAVKKGDKAWVSEDDYNRYKRDHAALLKRTEEARTAVKRGELQRELASARAIIERVEAQLADLS